MTTRRALSWPLIVSIIMMCALGMPSAVSASDSLNLCASHTPPAGAAVSIPADDAIHMSGGAYVHMFEEWYYNGLFSTVESSSDNFGWEALVFQFSFPPELFGLPSGYPQVIIKFTHQSLTDVEENEYKNDFIMVFDFGGVGFPVVANGYNLDLADANTGVEVHIEGASGSDEIQLIYADGTEVNFLLESLKNPLYSFFNGIGHYVDPITLEDHGTQFYYNRPWWVTVGSIDEPESVEKLTVGQAWQDRQFGTVIGTPGTNINNVSWVWYSLRLNNGEQYHMWDMKALDTNNTLIRVVNRQGPPFSCTQEIITTFNDGAIGTVVNPQNSAEVFGDQFTFEVPSRGLDGKFVSIISAPQIANTGLFNGTLEGAFKFLQNVSGSPVIGEGYVEEAVSCCQ